MIFGKILIMVVFDVMASPPPLNDDLYFCSVACLKNYVCEKL